MAEQIVSPDLNFVKEVIAAGADSLKKCYQCSTCTVVCEVTPNNKPFPRKEMLYAQWGMKDQLITNPDIWLCHQCSDCTAFCPRGAKPGEVLGAVRKVAIKEYSGPRFMAELTSNPKYALLLFAIPVAIFLVILGAIGHLDLTAISLNENGVIAFPEFIPDIYVDMIMVPTAGFAALVFLLAITKYWSAMAASAGRVGGGDIVNSITGTLIDIFTHKKFSACGVAKDRKVSHLLVFYSFIGLAITTSLGRFLRLRTEVGDAVSADQYTKTHRQCKRHRPSRRYDLHDNEPHEEPGKGGDRQLFRLAFDRHYLWHVRYRYTSRSDKAGESSRPGLYNIFRASGLYLRPVRICTIFEDGPYGIPDHGNGLRAPHSERLTGFARLKVAQIQYKWLSLRGS